MRDALERHWPEYLMEAAGLGLFMVSACAFSVLLLHPSSFVAVALPSPALRRALMGVAMGATAVAIIHSPWGRQSGAHINPSVTLAYLRLGKIARDDALLYILAQLTGGLAGVLLAHRLLGSLVSHPSVNFAATAPGPAGPAVAFAAEAAISFLLMAAILRCSASARLAPYTGLVAGCLVALYVSVEAPLSGMSMNPARSLASALPARSWMHLWIYLVAPPLGMLLAAEAALHIRGRERLACAKLVHGEDRRCIFCGHRETPPVPAPSLRAAAGS